MKNKIIALLLASISYCPLFADNVVLDNQTNYPKAKNSKIVVQWASSAKEVDEGNAALIQGTPLSSQTLLPLSQSGKNTLTVPDNAEYFRVLVWSKESKEPDLHTNWVNIIPNKTYQLKQDQLVPTVLMSGTGC